ncbi:unnamed protein product, partial [Didymodactylos carnosus]
SLYENRATIDYIRNHLLLNIDHKLSAVTTLPFENEAQLRHDPRYHRIEASRLRQEQMLYEQYLNERQAYEQYDHPEDFLCIRRDEFDKFRILLNNMEYIISTLKYHFVDHIKVIKHRDRNPDEAPTFP